MSNEISGTEVPVTRLDRILAVSSLTLIVAAVVCFILMIIGSMITVEFATPFWTIVTGIMYFGLPLGVVLFFTLLISNTVRRAKLAKAARGNQQR